MKNTEPMKKTIFTVAMLLGLTASYAGTTLESTPNVFSNEIKIKTIKKGSHLTVKNANGGVIYSEIVSKNALLTQNFDFTNLKDGLYTIETSHDFEVKSLKIAVANNNVTFLEDTATLFYKPLIRHEKNKVLVSKLALTDDALSVKIYYEGKEIYSETSEGKEVFERIYTLDPSKSGYYSVVLNANDRKYTSYFNL
ncbi:hypothetical protein [Winogradskyella sp. A3E31]|uniref:hypothetical protein n=1 Tax=Winogradskyella sp. A3E31 TaxID=3349637 RepID=UPI00398AFF63